MDQKDSFGDATPPHEPFDPSSTHSTPSPHSSLQIANDIDGVSDPDYGLDMTSSEYEQQGGYEEGETSGASSPDYDYLALDEQPGEEESLPASSPDYDYLAADIDEISEAQMNQQPDPHKPLEAPAENEYEYVIHDGEEYILGTLMVRVLQARNVKVRSCKHLQWVIYTECTLDVLILSQMLIFFCLITYSLITELNQEVFPLSSQIIAVPVTKSTLNLLSLVELSRHLHKPHCTAN